MHSFKSSLTRLADDEPRSILPYEQCFTYLYKVLYAAYFVADIDGMETSNIEECWNIRGLAVSTAWSRPEARATST
jgi:hypothetical protein